MFVPVIIDNLNQELMRSVPSVDFWSRDRASVNSQPSSGLSRQKALTDRIDPDQDSLEFFLRLTAGVHQISLGRPWLPKGIWLV